MLEETRQLGAAITDIPQFAEDAVTNESWYNNPAIPSITASLKFGQFIYAYIGDDMNWSFDHERYVALYPELEVYLDESASITITTRVELWNLRLAAKEIHLSDGVTVRRLTDNERRQSITQSLATGRFGDPESYKYYGHDPPTPELYLEITRTGADFLTSGSSLTNVVNFNAGNEVRELAHALLLGLRLLTPGSFGIGPFEVTADNRLVGSYGMTSISVARPWPAPEPQKGKKKFGREPSPWHRPHRQDVLNSAWGSYTTRTPIGAPVMISKKTARDLASLWPVLLIPTHRTLEAAFHRFELSYERVDPEDRLIDHWVAMESLFTENEPQLSRSASQRLAYFIEPGHRPKRLKVYKDAKASYKLRSTIVHGDAVYDPADVAESTVQTEEYLREALLKCLRSSRPPDKTALDNEMMFKAKIKRN
jgi:hypothetical protein